jgi:hypothetical protein
MATMLAILAVAGMLILRIGVPLGIVFALGYFLKRLDARWEAEARAEAARAETLRVEQERRERVPVAERPLVTPRRPNVDVPGPQLPFDPALIRRPAPGLVLIDGNKHCWDVNGCTEESKAKCPAVRHPQEPCWQALQEAEGQLPTKCPSCNIYQRYPLA